MNYVVAVVTILLGIGVVITFWYTAKSSIKHNNQIIKWLKEK